MCQYFNLVPVEEDGLLWDVISTPTMPQPLSTLSRPSSSARTGDALLVAGDLNVDLVAPEGNRNGENIMAEIVTKGLEDISTHFLLWKNHGLNMEVRGACTATGYILAPDGLSSKNGPLSIS